MTKAAELAKMGEVLTNSQIGGRRNMVINGAMQVAQRATSATGVGASTTYPTLDRMKIVASTSGRATMSQSTDAPDGFANSLKLECTTADTSIASGEFFLIRQSFEGQDLQQFKKGTSSAEKVTVSFYVKGNANATYQVELQDVDNTRYAGQTFSVTTSWNRVSLTFVGDTSGAFDNDNAESLRLNIWLHAGATYTGGTFTSNTWQTTDNQRLDDITSFLDSTDRTIFVTGWQMEIGEQATPFEHRSFGEEERLCQRYYYRHKSDGSNQNMLGVGVVDSSTAAFMQIVPPVSMRVQPTSMETTGTASDYEVRQGAGADIVCNSVPTLSGDSTNNVFIVSYSTAGSLTTYSACMGRAMADGVHFSFYSEL